MNDLTHGAPAPVLAARKGSAPPFTLERIRALRPRAPGLVSFETTRPTGFRFTPGHYARLGLGPDADVVWRPYSIASPADEERLAFQLTRVPGGAFNGLFESLRTGDPIRVDRRSFGFLTLAQVAPGGTLWLLATGTGVAPFVSMLADPATWMRHERVVLVHSVRHALELATGEVQAAMGRRSPEERARLLTVPVVTREATPGALRARIGELLRTGALEAVAGGAIAPDRARVMLCGNPEMIRDVRAFARERGLEPGRRGIPGSLATEGYW